MQHSFSRTEILIGQAGLEKLAQSSVSVFGIGGVGSYTVEALARAGIGHLTLIDFDEICLTNLNRQLHALRSTIGQAKVDVMKQRILDINPELQVDTMKEFYSETNAEKLLAHRTDYIVDAIDTVSGKVSLAIKSLERNIPFISSMGAGNRLTAANYRVADISQTTGDPLAKAMRKLLRQQGITKGVKVVFSPDLPLHPVPAEDDSQSNQTFPNDDMQYVIKKQIPGSISFVPSVVGLLIAGEVIRTLLTVPSYYRPGTE